jgi:hypothetical protein
MRSPWCVCVCACVCARSRVCPPINFRIDRFHETQHEHNATEAHPHIVFSKIRTISNNMANAGSCQVGKRKSQTNAFAMVQGKYTQKCFIPLEEQQTLQCSTVARTGENTN